MGATSHRYSALFLEMAGSLLATALLTAVPAVAQNARPADQTPTLGEVVVTAQFRQEKLQDTPIAITAITSQDIEQHSFTTSYELGYTVPNASFRPAQAAFGNIMTAYIRGVGQNDFDQAFEPGVGIYVDDVYQPFMLGTQMDLLDMERVEVLRGPQGTLFGRGSIGGVMRLISKKAEGSDTGNVDITTGSFDRIDVRAGYDFKLSDSVFARITGVSKHSKGYQEVVDFACRYPSLSGTLQVRDPLNAHDCVTGTQGGINVSGVRGQLRWVANENVDTNLSFEYQKDTSEAKADSLLAVIYPLDLSGNPAGGYSLWNNEYASHVPTAAQPWGFGIPFDSRFVPGKYNVTYATYNDPASGLTFNPQAGLEKMAESAKVEWKLNDKMTLTTVLAYTDIKSQLVSDTDQSPMNLQLTSGVQHFAYGTGEIRLAGRAFERMDWTVGAFFYEGYAANHQVVSFPPLLYGIVRGAGAPDFVVAGLIDGPLNIGVNANNIADTSAQAGFAQMTYDLTDKAHLTLGVRYGQDKKHVNFDNGFFTGPIKADDSHFDWKVGMDYKLTTDTLLYGSVSTGYRPPAYNPRPFTAAQAVAVGGEEMTAYELGVKADLFNRTLRANAAIFYSDYNKRIVPIGGTDCSNSPPALATDPGAMMDSNGNICLAPTSLTSYRQLTHTKVQGAEVELTWRPVDSLTFTGTYGYTDFKSPEIDHCDFNQDGQPDAGLTCNGKTNYVPKYNWSAGLAYDFRFGSGSTLTPRVDVYGQSEICSGVTVGFNCAPGYELVDVRLQWASARGGWTAAIGGTNVGNKEYLLNTFDLTAFGQNTVEGQPGRPAEWYLNLSRKF